MTRVKLYAAVVSIPGQLPIATPAYLATTDTMAAAIAVADWAKLCDVQAIERLPRPTGGILA